MPKRLVNNKKIFLRIPKRVKTLKKSIKTFIGDKTVLPVK